MKYLLIILVPCFMFSQHIKGKVYDETTTAKGIKVYNQNNKAYTYTDNDGEFTLAASVGDTLFFESLFHVPKYKKLEAVDVREFMVFELKKMVNELGEVLINNEKQKEFNPETYTANMGMQLANDKKNNPHLYKPQSEYSYGINILAVFGQAIKLFKRKNKPKAITYIKHNDLDSLFRNDTFFNLKLLNQDLGIQKHYTHLFFEYCEYKNMTKTLLSKNKQFILLDSMVNHSKSFLKIVADFEASPDSLNVKN